MCRAQMWWQLGPHCAELGDQTHSVKSSPLLLFSHTVVYDSATPWTAARQASLSLTISWSLPKFMPIASVISSNHLILSCLFSCLQSFPASGTLPMGPAVHIRWPKYWLLSMFLLFSHLLNKSSFFSLVLMSTLYHKSYWKIMARETQFETLLTNMLLVLTSQTWTISVCLHEY